MPACPAILKSNKYDKTKLTHENFFFAWTFSSTLSYFQPLHKLSQVSQKYVFSVLAATLNVRSPVYVYEKTLHVQMF